MANSDDEDTPDLPAHLGTPSGLPDIDRYKGVQKSEHLQKAEKKALEPTAPAQLLAVAAMEIRQDAKLRTEKKDKKLVCTHLYQFL